MAEFEDNFDKEIKKLTEKQIDNYYQKDITDGLSYEQRAYLYFKDQSEAYADVMGDYEGPAYDAQTMDRDIPNEIDEEYAKSLEDKPITDGNISDMDDIDNDPSIKNQVDAPNAIQKYSMKGLDFLGKAVAPIDEALEIGIPKLLANTAAAPFAQNLVKVFRQLTLVNLGKAATKGLYESEVMGENYQNLLKDPNNPEYIAERDRLNQEGIQAFSEHMSTYDPSIRFIDKFTEEKLGFNQTDVATKVYGGVKNLFRGGRK